MLVSLFIYFSRVDVRHNDVTAQAGTINVVLHRILPQAFLLPPKWPTEKVRSFGNSVQPGRIPFQFDRKYSTTGRTATGYSQGKKNDCRGRCNSRSKHSIHQHGDDRQQQTQLTNFIAKTTCHLSAQLSSTLSRDLHDTPLQSQLREDLQVSYY